MLKLTDNIDNEQAVLQRLLKPGISQLNSTSLSVFRLQAVRSDSTFSINSRPMIPDAAVSLCTQTNSVYVTWHRNYALQLLSPLARSKPTAQVYSILSG